MSAPVWAFALDASPASAALAAALLAQTHGSSPTGPSPKPSPTPSRLALAFDGPPEPIRARLAQACARRGLAVELEPGRARVGERELAILADPGASGATIRLREGRVELQRGRSARSLGEPAELLAAAPLLEAFERGAGLRWALVSVVEGRDPWAAPVDLCERAPGKAFEAGLARYFPALVGKIGYSEALGPQLGSAIHASVLLGPGASVDGVRDLLAAQASDARSRWPRLRSRAGFGSADCFGDPSLALDLDALTGAGPLIRIAGYFDPPALLAGDLLRRLAA